MPSTVEALDLQGIPCGDHFSIHTNLKSLYCLPGMNMVSVNYTSIKNNFWKKHRRKSYGWFLYDPANVGNLISEFVFSKPSLYTRKFSIHILLKPSLKDLSITLPACEMSATVQYLEHSLALPFFGIGTKTDLIQSCGHHWVFQVCWHIECGTFTASSFRIWNSSAGIPSLPLTLFGVMLLKAHLTSHSRMSGSRWVNTPLWLSMKTFFV